MNFFKFIIEHIGIKLQLNEINKLKEVFIERALTNFDKSSV
jgi:hypothetical protein